MQLILCLLLFPALSSGDDPVPDMPDPGECSSNEMVSCNTTDLCIPKKWICDGDNDCEGGSDEKNCENRDCNPNQFTCTLPGLLSGGVRIDTGTRNPKCIPDRWKCDGEPDCEDHSDEKDCAYPKCDENTQFTCAKEGEEKHPYCIPIGWKCDGQEDCHSGEDEDGCEQKAPQCSETEFQCKDERGNPAGCIFKDWTCDYDNDCPGGFDEWPLNTACNNTHHCKEGYFECSSNKYCIPERWRCDGERDCQDASDEADCPPPSRTSPVPAHTRCSAQEWQCLSGGCIHKEWRCDTDPDCLDASDEDPKLCGHLGGGTTPAPPDCAAQGLVHCAHNATDHSAHFELCIAREQLCNGQPDCPRRQDGSYFDENPTICRPNAVKRITGCNRDELSCEDPGKHCVSFIRACDGVQDCPSYPGNSTSADENEQLCSAAKARNCGDGNNGGCGHICRPLARGAFCDCGNGYTKDKKTGEACVDIDECALPGTCSQTCVNRNGSHVCHCLHGYWLQGDGRTCRAIGPERPKLLISNRAVIREIDLDTKQYLPLIDDLHSAVAMDFHYKRRLLVWSDVAAETIKMCVVGKDYMDKPPEASENRKCNVTVVIDEGIHTPDGLAVDWVHNLLFWTDTGLDTISVVPLDKHAHRRTLFNTSLDEPRAIAVDPKAGLLFWTDWGRVPKIERSGLDGSGRKIIVKDGLQWPNGLALDLVNEKVYWADAKLKQISSCDYDGNNVRLILQSVSALRHPFSLSVFEDKLYWTDWDTESVHAADKFTGADREVIAGGLYGPMTVRVFHSQSQPDVEVNKCEYHGCSDICLPRPNPEHQFKLDGSSGDLLELKEELSALDRRTSFVCGCRDGAELSKDGRQCLYGEDAALTGLAKASGILAKLCLGLLLVLVILIVGAILYRRGVFGRHEQFSFDNPVYRRTVASDGWPDPNEGGEVDIRSGAVAVPVVHSTDERPPSRKSPEPPTKTYNEGMKALLVENEVVD